MYGAASSSEPRSSSTPANTLASSASAEGASAGKAGQQGAGRRPATVEGEADVRLSASRRAACRHSPAACACSIASTTCPCSANHCGGGTVQRRDLVRGSSSQLEPQQIGEEMVVAEPRSPHVERHDERVGLLEPLQDPLGARAAGENVGERAAHPLQDRRAQQQVAHLGRAGDRGPRPAGTRQRCARCRRTRRRTARARDARRARSPPAAAPPPNPRSARAASPAPASDSTIPAVVQQLPRLLRREAQVGRPKLE